MFLSCEIYSNNRNPFFSLFFSIEFIQSLTTIFLKMFSVHSNNIVQNKFGLAFRCEIERPQIDVVVDLMSCFVECNAAFAECPKMSDLQLKENQKWIKNRLTELNKSAKNKIEMANLWISFLAPHSWYWAMLDVIQLMIIHSCCHWWCCCYCCFCLYRR